MKKIPLGKNQFAMVDDKDYEMLVRLTWHRDTKGYAVHGQHRKGMGAANIKMHRLILNAPDGVWVDHINRDRLDNRRSNIRLVTPSQNTQNAEPNSRNTSGYRGVCYRKETRRWRAAIRFNGHSIEVGSSYKTPQDAAIAYNQAALKYYGEFAYQNPI